MLSNSEKASSQIAARDRINALARMMRGNEAFVWIEPGKTGYRMIGLFVPGMPASGTNVNNRFVVPDKTCPPWFMQLCEDLTLGKIPDMMVRVKLSGVAGDVMAFATPKARDREHAMQEWERYRKQFRPSRITIPRPEMSDDLYCRFAYDIYVNDINAERHMLQTQQRWDIVDYMAGPSNAPFEKAIAVNRRTGALVLLSGVLASKATIPDYDPATDTLDLSHLEPKFTKVDEVLRQIKRHTFWDRMTEPQEVIELIEAQHKRIAA